MEQLCSHLGLCFSPQNVFNSFLFVCFTRDRNAGMMGTVTYLQKTYLTGRALLRDVGSEHYQSKIRIDSWSSGFGVSSISIL